MSAAGVAGEQSAAPGVAHQYETLRTSALGGGLPLEARSGLALFLRRGMWGWAHAVAVLSTSPQPARSSLATSTPENEQRAVIHLFAAMAMRSTKRRAHERIPQSAIASHRA
jgi:hypothetical protein